MCLLLHFLGVLIFVDVKIYLKRDLGFYWNTWLHIWGGGTEWGKDKYNLLLANGRFIYHRPIDSEEIIKNN